MDSVTAEATAKKLVSVLALDAGFEGITASALESLTRAFESYTQQMYSIAHSFADLAGRTRPDLHDLQQAFDDMNVRPTSLASYIRAASNSSMQRIFAANCFNGLLWELKRTAIHISNPDPPCMFAFFSQLLETPLLRGPLQETVPKPQKKKEKKTVFLDSDIEDNSDSDDEEPMATSTPGTRITARTVVPDHLPPFPSKHSYKQTPVFVKRPTDPQKIRELNTEQSRLVESNLKRLMAAENKVAMAAAHKDGTTAGVTTDLLIVKEEQEPAESVDRRALTKLEALPVVNYELSKRQQLLSVSNRDSSHRQIQQLHELQGGHHRGESLGGSLSGPGTGAAGSVLNLKAEWRKERRRMRKEQQNAMEEMEQNLHHKRLRQESSHNSQLKLVSMDIDAQ
ncbi:transcription factor TFIID complex subunit 8 C-term-domain-containing protein [Gamsiella multidivaricata]|uniref:transcription factor TFIID complex subunit 8 C-term-domain-containing protein n=1 Tax=Gamsiella multidivaricata TaxID=101098 RepID=UPI00221E8401|nr:transcription factor TFIID complex subunit 8 C-term-domain-containing protein [Gamsiella multidivaricata]KAI7819971.1 transcription factor TFIID complex subunit 8 C-term-domain-containing protein [Gamsiella multidivaricata]